MNTLISLITLNAIACNVVFQALQIMWKGVIGVFSVLVIIAIIVWILSLTDRKGNKDESDE